MRRESRLPVLLIPAEMQKNDTEEAIPLLPWFEAVLTETPPAERTGWAFNPLTLQSKFKWGKRVGRLKPQRVGQVIGEIGERAKVIVAPSNPKTGRPIKYASSHDLRRSCADRLLGAGVPPMTIATVMRHASWQTTRRYYAPGDVQADAAVLRDCLGGTVPIKSGYSLKSELT
jgi:integrase